MCRITVSLTDSETGEEVPGLVRLLREGNPLAISSLQDRCAGLPGDANKLGWHVLLEKTELTVPADDGMSIEAFSGLDTEMVQMALDLAGHAEKSVVIELGRVFPPESDSWLAGNTHVHLRNLTRQQSDRYLREVPAGDGLSVVYVSHLERAIVDRTYITNSYSRDDLVDGLSSDTLKFGNGEEHRHNFGGGGEGFGHVMLLDLQELVRPVSIGPGISQQGGDSPPLRRGIDTAREQEATVIWCHNGFGLEDLPNWIAGRVDAQNIFDGGNRGSYGDTFYRYLNVGMKVPFSTGTDWFIYDFSRVYVHLEEGEKFSAENWLAGLRAGRTVITNGPWLDFSVDGKGPGAEIEVGKNPKFVAGRAVGRADFGALQLVHNGEVIEEVPAKRGARGYGATIRSEVPAAEAGWLALRIAPKKGVTNKLGKELFAHTSPVYVTDEGERRFDPMVAKEMLAEVEAGWKAIEEQGKFSTDTEKAVVAAVYTEAIETLREWIAERK